MTYPVRILQCFGRMDRGGSESFIMNIYRNIDREKVQFDFVVHTSEKCAFDDEIYSLGGRIFNIPQYNVKNHLRYKEAWNEIFKNHSNDWVAIHAHMFTTSAIYLKITKQNGLVGIAHSHSTSWGNNISSLIKKIIQYPIKYNADYMFACSVDAGRWLYGSKAIKQKNFHVLKNVIETDKYLFNKEDRDVKRKELKIENHFVIGHVARFHPLKNHDFIVEVFKEVYEKNNNAVLLLIGDGELKKLIKKKVENLGLTNAVIFTGVRADVAQLLQAIDVFFFPSQYEGVPITLLEAQASGLKCIVSDTISIDVKITDNIEFVSLNKPKEYWADIILRCEYGFKRKSNIQEIYNSGYDVTENTKWLQDFYTNL